MSLNVAKIGGNYKIDSLCMPESIRGHMETMGILPGARIRLVQSVPSGCIIEVFGSRVAIGNAVAKCISVESGD